MKKSIMLFSVLLLLGTTYVWASLPDIWFEREYYSDATQSVIVGGADYFCGSTVYTWGESTPYWENINEGPCGGPGDEGP